MDTGKGLVIRGRLLHAFRADESTVTFNIRDEDSGSVRRVSVKLETARVVASGEGIIITD